MVAGGADPRQPQADIDAALASGEVIRTWPMRGTIHLIHPQNARWMLELTGSRALMGLQKRWDYLGLDRQTVDRAADVLRMRCAAATGSPADNAWTCCPTRGSTPGRAVRTTSCGTRPDRRDLHRAERGARNRPSFCSTTGRPSNALTARGGLARMAQMYFKATARRRAWTSRAGPA